MRILLLGNGVSNQGVSRLLDHLHVPYDSYDTDTALIDSYDLIIKSPGIRRCNAPFVITDIELAYLYSSNPFVAITGTNGKTSTVMMLQTIIPNSIACGNIGYAICDALLDHPKANYIVEASSFQLSNIALFRPYIAVITNISKAHQDYHDDMFNYVHAKSNITKNQKASDYLIYDFDSIYCREIASISKARKYSFSLRDKSADCCIIDKKVYLFGSAYFSLEQLPKEITFFSSSILITTLISTILSIKKEDLLNNLKNFKPVEYRFFKIAKDVYNDSKSTNPASTLYALESLDGPVSLICGGYYRKEDLSVLALVTNKIANVYAYGETKEFCAQYFASVNVLVQCFDTLKEATIKAFCDRKEETILYSPMFASFDQFGSYIDRGEAFNKIVLDLTNSK